MTFNSRIAEWLDPTQVALLQERISRACGAQAVLLDTLGRPLDGGRRPPADPLAMDALAEGTLQRRTEEDGRTCDLAVPVLESGSVACVWLIRGVGLVPEAGAVWFAPDALDGLCETVSALSSALLDSVRLLSQEAVEAREARQMAFTDPVCDLPNHRQLERDLEGEGRWESLVVLDVRELGKINELYGREYGDELLRELCAYLQSLHLQHCRLYRLTAADFGLLVGSDTDRLARRVSDSIRLRCRQPWLLLIGGHRKDLLVSVVVGALPLAGLADAGFHNLDAAVEYTLDLARRVNHQDLTGAQVADGFQSRLTMELELRSAVREGMRGFSLAWQPIVDPGLAMWRGVEVLCRWERETLGAVNPAEFIPLAERGGLIGSLGPWVMDKALEQVRAWKLDQVEDFRLGVNLSPVQLADADLHQQVAEMLQRHQYPADKLCLEITGSGRDSLSDHAWQSLERLPELGVAIALDDFGSGSAALDLLDRLPVEQIKTDSALVRDMAGDEYLQRLFGVIVELAHDAGIKVVAKGVETDLQTQLALGQGADRFQGMRFALPMGAAEMEAQLEKFHRPQPELVSMGYARLDLARLSGEQGGYNLTPSLHKLLNQCMRELFSNPDGNEAIDTALARIGRALGVSRSYVFLRERDGSFSNTNEWCNHGVKPEKDALQHAPIMELSPGWIEALIRDGLLVASDINTLEQGAFESLNPQGIKAVAEFPIWREGELCGFVGFDDCERNRMWTREEVQMLHTLTGIIAATIGKLELQEQLRSEGRRLENMLNAMDTMIYVSDLETDRILFANTTLETMYGKPLTGQLCWEALHGRQERCEFCPIVYLTQNPGKSYQWEFYNEVLGGHFRIRDSIIPWEGRMAHFEYAENITQLKQYHKQLETFASTDMLTGTLNRSSFEQEAVSQIGRAQVEQLPLTLAFVDIDGLKMENDKNGHAAGDQLILNVVRELRSHVRSTDQMGRYGGDEFVILFAGCGQKIAERRMQQAVQGLQALEREQGVRASFSYGLAGIEETQGTDAQTVLDALLSLADHRMMERKNQKRASGQSGIRE